jgi:hypothetical protein
MRRNFRNALLPGRRVTPIVAGMLAGSIVGGPIVIFIPGGWSYGRRTVRGVGTFACLGRLRAALLRIRTIVRPVRLIHDLIS